MNIKMPRQIYPLPSPGAGFIPPHPDCSSSLPMSEDTTDKQGMYYLLEDPSSGQFYLTNSLSYITQGGAPQAAGPGLPGESQRLGAQTHTPSTQQVQRYNTAESYQTTNKTIPSVSNMTKQTPLRNSAHGILQYLSGGCKEDESAQVTEGTFNNEAYLTGTEYTPQANFSNSLEPQLCENGTNLSDLIREEVLNDDVDHLYTNLKELGFVTSPTKQPNKAQAEARGVTSSVLMNASRSDRLVIPKKTWASSSVSEDSEGLVVASPASSVQAVQAVCGRVESIPSDFTHSDDPLYQTGQDITNFGSPDRKQCVQQSIKTANVQSTSQVKNQTQNCVRYKKKYVRNAKSCAVNSIAVQCDLQESNAGTSTVQHSQPCHISYLEPMDKIVIPANMKQVTFGSVTVYGFLQNRITWCPIAELIQRKILPLAVNRLKSIITKMKLTTHEMTHHELNVLKIIKVLPMQTKNKLLVPGKGVIAIVQELRKMGWNTAELRMIAGGKLSVKGLEYIVHPISNKLVEILNKTRAGITQVEVTNDLSDSSSSHKQNRCCNHQVSSETVKVCKTVRKTDYALPAGKFNIAESGLLMDYFRSVGINPSSSVTTLIQVKNKPPTCNCKNSVSHDTVSLKHGEPEMKTPDSTSIGGRKKPPNCDLLQSAVNQVFGDELSVVSSSLDLVPSQSSDSSSTGASPRETEKISSSSDNCLKGILVSPPLSSCLESLENAKDIPGSMSIFPTQLSDSAVTTKHITTAKSKIREKNNVSNTCNRESSGNVHNKLDSFLSKSEEKVVVLKTDRCDGLTSLMGGYDTREPVGSKLNAPIIRDAHQTGHEELINSDPNRPVATTHQTGNKKDLLVDSESIAPLTTTHQTRREDLVRNKPSTPVTTTHKTEHEGELVISKTSVPVTSMHQTEHEIEPVPHSLADIIDAEVFEVTPEDGNTDIGSSEEDDNVDRQLKNLTENNKQKDEGDVTEAALATSCPVEVDVLPPLPMQLVQDQFHDCFTTNQQESKDRNQTLSKLLLKMEKLRNCNSPNCSLHVLAEAAEVLQGEFMNKGSGDAATAESATEEEILNAVEKYWRPHLPRQVYVLNGKIQVEVVLKKRKGVSSGKNALKFISGVLGQMIIRQVKEGNIAAVEWTENSCEPPKYRSLYPTASTAQRDVRETKPADIRQKSKQTGSKSSSGECIESNRIQRSDMCGQEAGHAKNPEKATIKGHINKLIFPVTDTVFDKKTKGCTKEVPCPETPVCNNKMVCLETATVLQSSQNCLNSQKDVDNSQKQKRSTNIPRLKTAAKSKQRKVYTKKRKVTSESNSDCVSDVETDFDPQPSGSKVSVPKKIKRETKKKTQDGSRPLQPKTVSTKTNIESLLVEVNRTTVAQIIDLTPAPSPETNSAGKSYKKKTQSIDNVLTSGKISAVVSRPRQDRILSKRKKVSIDSKNPNSKYLFVQEGDVATPLAKCAKKTCYVRDPAKRAVKSINVRKSVYDFTDTDDNGGESVVEKKKSWVSVDEDISVHTVIPQSLERAQSSLQPSHAPAEAVQQTKACSKIKRPRGRPRKKIRQKSQLKS